MLPGGGSISRTQWASGVFQHCCRMLVVVCSAPGRIAAEARRRGVAQAGRATGTGSDPARRQLRADAVRALAARRSMASPALGAGQLCGRAPACIGIRGTSHEAAGQRPIESLTRAFGKG